MVSMVSKAIGLLLWVGGALGVGVGFGKMENRGHIRLVQKTGSGISGSMAQVHRNGKGGLRTGRSMINCGFYRIWCRRYGWK